MSEFGLDEELNEKEEEKQEIAVIGKTKRRPWYEWEVGGNVYKLKLTTAAICKLEEKFRRNLLNVVAGSEIPPLGVMLTVIQAAMLQHHHGVKYTKVQEIYDVYLREGGNQLSLYADVIMGGIMTVSGFFTEDQTENLENKLETMNEMM